MLNNSTKIIISKKILTYILVLIILMISFNQSYFATHIEKEEKNNIQIDQRLHLTKKHLPILINAKSKTNNETMIIILSRIIDTLEKQESINAQDMKQILTDISFKPLIWISCYKPISGSSSGKFFCFPGYLFIYIFGEDWTSRDEITSPYIGPSVILIGRGSITIHRILESVKADYYLSLGFLGLINLLSYERGTIINFIGISFLTITFSYP